EDAMPAPLLPMNASVEGILDEYIYTLVRLRADPLAAPLLPRFEAFFDDWKKIRDHEIELRIQHASGEAGIGLCDDGLDLLVDTVSHTLPQLENEDRASALCLHLFNGIAPSVFKRPVLGEQLEAMRHWAEALSTQQSPELAALAPKLTEQIEAADRA